MKKNRTHRAARVKGLKQSNCFVVVERGGAMQNIAMERNLQKSGEMRDSGNFGAGQMVAADFTMKPEITLQRQLHAHRRRTWRVGRWHLEF